MARVGRLAHLRPACICRRPCGAGGGGWEHRGGREVAGRNFVLPPACPRIRMGKLHPGGGVDMGDGLWQPYWAAGHQPVQGCCFLYGQQPDPCVCTCMALYFLYLCMVCRRVGHAHAHHGRTHTQHVHTYTQFTQKRRNYAHCYFVSHETVIVVCGAGGRSTVWSQYGTHTHTHTTTRKTHARQTRANNTKTVLVKLGPSPLPTGVCPKAIGGGGASPKSGK